MSASGYVSGVSYHIELLEAEADKIERKEGWFSQ
jgi:hypothetical protein